MSKKIQSTAAILLIFPLLLGSSWPAAAGSLPSLAQTGLHQSAPGQPLSRLFLPVIQRIRLGLVFGTETGAIRSQYLLDRAQDAGMLWLRGAVLSWKAVEPVRSDPPTYDWSSVPESGLVQAAQRGMNVILTVKFTPGWAQRDAGYACGPVAREQIPAFAAFIQAAVARYSAPPFNVKYWEFGNEPDVGRDGTNQNSSYGCWGEWGDIDYFGGRYYGEVLKAFYPAVKSADPQSRVLIGGLLLACDPTYYASSPPVSPPYCYPSHFFEGILVEGAGNSFDIVNFHGYPSYVEGKFHDEDYPTWQPRGGVVLGKADFLRQVMAKYSLSKPLLVSEAGLPCPAWNPAECASPAPSFFERQADYVPWLFTRVRADGMLGAAWYTLDGPGWNNSGLLNASQAPRPAYRALQFLAQELSGMTYTGRVDQYPGFYGYQFQKRGKSVWVLLPADQEAHTLEVPAAARVLDLYGTELEVNDIWLVSSRPIYIEFIQ